LSPEPGETLKITATTQNARRRALKKIVDADSRGIQFRDWDLM